MTTTSLVPSVSAMQPPKMAPPIFGGNGPDVGVTPRNGETPIKKLIYRNCV